MRLVVDGPVATVTLDRPERRNAQTPATWRALAAIGSALPDPVRVVVLRGDGAAFSAGLDRDMLTPDGIAGEPSLVPLAGRDDDTLDQTIAGFQEAFTWLRRDGIVSVAAVQGHAVGAGFQLALACDLRVLAADARFAMPEPSLGLVPDLGGTRLLVELLGYPRALEICATGRQVEAAEAVALRLAELVVPTTELEATVADLVVALLAAPAGAVSETKALLRDAAARTSAQQLAAERAAQARCLRVLAAG